VADQLYLSLWFPNFRLAALAPAVVGVLHQVASAGGASAVTAAAVYPISWNETPVYQRIYDEEDGEAAKPELAVTEAMEMLHEDYAYEFEVKWNLVGAVNRWAIWTRSGGKSRGRCASSASGRISMKAATSRTATSASTSAATRHSCRRRSRWEPEAATHVQQNVQKLIDVTQAIQNNLAVSSRLLWSESGEKPGREADCAAAAAELTPVYTIPMLDEASFRTMPTPHSKR